MRGWELEPACRLLEPTELPRLMDESIPGEDFDALVRATRWGAIQPYLDPDGAVPATHAVLRVMGQAVFGSLAAELPIPAGC